MWGRGDMLQVTCYVEHAVCVQALSALEWTADSQTVCDLVMHLPPCCIRPDYAGDSITFMALGSR